jgi:hypothetical protein
MQLGAGPERLAARRQELDDVGEVPDLAEVREAEEARDEVDVVAGAPQDWATVSPGMPTLWM